MKRVIDEIKGVLIIDRILKLASTVAISYFLFANGSSPILKLNRL